VAEVYFKTIINPARGTFHIYRAFWESDFGTILIFAGIFSAEQ